MPPSGRSGLSDVRRPVGSGAHTLLAADGAAARAGTVDWVDHELSGGSKVLFKGWIGSGRDGAGHWLTEPGGIVGAARALERGQLELLDYRTVVERCGGTTEGLFRLQQDEVRDAMAAGWSSVAMAQETTYRPMADDGEVAEFVAQERGYDRLARAWPLNTLCQLTVPDEAPTAVWESVALHHDDVVAHHWSAQTVAGRWHLVGELDVAVAREFGAAVHGAFRGTAGDLHVDLGRVAFLDVACAQVLMLAARSVARRQRLVLHRSSAVLRDVLAVVGIPRTVEFGSGWRP